MEISYTVIDNEHTEFGELVLRRYQAGGETGYEILIDDRFLMATHGSHSERAMAELAWQRLPSISRDYRVLIGGLGAGHTLRSVLDLERVGTVVVAEIGAKVVLWNRRYFRAANGAAVDDERVRIEIADVREIIDSSAARWDLILLDVDNGPGWLATEQNSELYSAAGLQRCSSALTEHGVLAIWSPACNQQLAGDLHRSFACVEEIDTNRAGRREGEPGAIIYLAHSVTT